MIAWVSMPPPNSSSNDFALVVIRPSFLRRSRRVVPSSKLPTSAAFRASAMMRVAIDVPILRGLGDVAGGGGGDLHEVGVAGLPELVGGGRAHAAQFFEGHLTLGGLGFGRGRVGASGGFLGHVD